MTRQKKCSGELDIDMGKLHVHMSNTPKWAYILIAIGIMFFLILAGASIQSMMQTSRVDKIVGLLKSKQTLTPAEASEVERFTKVEKEELVRRMEDYPRMSAQPLLIEAPVSDGSVLKVEQTMSPDKPVEITREKENE